MSSGMRNRVAPAIFGGRQGITEPMMVPFGAYYSEAVLVTALLAMLWYLVR